MGLIWLFIFDKLIEIIVPFPDGPRIFIEEASRQDSLDIVLLGILLLVVPGEPTVCHLASIEGRDAARCTEARSSQYCDFLAANHMDSSFNCSHLLRLATIFVRFFKSTSEQESEIIHELCIYVSELLLNLCKLEN